MKKCLALVTVLIILFAQTPVFAQQTTPDSDGNYTVLSLVVSFLPMIIITALVIAVVLICNKKERLDGIGINTSMGTKWFVFYAWVRPWMGIIVGICSVLSEIGLYGEVYLRYWWMSLCLLLTIAQILTGFWVFIKSRKEYYYIHFVRFVRGVLVFEVISAAYLVGVRDYFTNGLLITRAILVALFCLTVAYFFWYRLNMKYFEKRIPTVVEIKPVRAEIEQRESFVDENNWEEEIRSLTMDELYLRYNDSFQWTEDYRFLCQQELIKRQEEAELVTSKESNNSPIIPETNECVCKTGSVSFTQNTSDVAKVRVPEKLLFNTNLLSAIWTVIAMIAIIVAMNVQDANRNVVEDWNATIVYCVLLVVLCVGLGLEVIAWIKKQFKFPICCSTAVLAAVALIAAEGSVFSGGYYLSDSSYVMYVNESLVRGLNILWVLCAIIKFITTLVPGAYLLAKKICKTWHKSVFYRTKRLKTVAQVYSYFEKGIITEEEYERTKKDILKHIETQ